MQSNEIKKIYIYLFAAMDIVMLLKHLLTDQNLTKTAQRQYENPLACRQSLVLHLSEPNCKPFALQIKFC